MGDKKLLDLVAATGEEGLDYTLAEVLPEVVSTFGEYVVSEGIAAVAGELVGAILPRLNSVRLSYKQFRLERNVKIMLERLVASNTALADRVAVLEASAEGRRFARQAGELMLDGIVDEFQEEKVRYNVNGFINLLNTEDADMNMALTFFKTLYELNDLDIRMLNDYDWRHPLNIEVVNEFVEKIDYQQIRFIKEKLYRLGLLQSKNEEKSNKNIELIISYLQKLDKEARSRTPKAVKLPSFQRIHSSDSYSITPLGRALLQLISDECDLDNLDEDDPAEYEEPLDENL